MLGRDGILSKYEKSSSSSVVLPDISQQNQLESVVLGKKMLMTPKQTSPRANSTNSNVSEDHHRETNTPPRSSDRLQQCTSPVKNLIRMGNTPPMLQTEPLTKEEKTNYNINTANLQKFSQTAPMRSLSGSGARGNPSAMLSRSSLNSIRKSKIPAPTRQSMDKSFSYSTDQGSSPSKHSALAARQTLPVDSSAMIKNISTATVGVLDLTGVIAPSIRLNDHEGDSATDYSKSSGGSGNSHIVRQLTSNVDALTFQQACKNRVARQKASLQATQAASGAPHSFTAKEVRSNIREATAAAAEAAQRRRRAEIYAINRYLGQRETAKFANFLADQERQLQADDVSWCTADSSVMPTPRYRTEKERRYDNSQSKSRSKFVGGV